MAVVVDVRSRGWFELLEGAIAEARERGERPSLVFLDATDEALVRRISRTMALRKVGQPEDVARQIVVLASDVASGHVTGQIVVVAGGMEGRTVHEES